MNSKLIALSLILIVAVGGATAWLHAELGRPVKVAEGGQLFSIERGASLNSVIAQLSRRGILQTNKVVARGYALLTRSRGTVKAGEYRLEPEMNTGDVLALVRSGKVVKRHITFVEGWTFEQWRAHLAQTARIEPVLVEETPADIMARLGEKGLRPEGQFFPDTYHFTAGETDLSILRRAHKRIRKVIEEEWRHRRVGSVLSSPYDALILASIVEKETGYEPDRPLIARVFINRLEQGIRLQSDPTVIYGLGDTFDGDLTRRDLRDDSPYNTYRYRELPPTPISNPGLASIRAVMQPAPGDYLYFVGRGDGTSHFSTTLEEHNEAVTRYQKTDRVQDYRSVPREAP